MCTDKQKAEEEERKKEAEQKKKEMQQQRSSQGQTRQVYTAAESIFYVCIFDRYSGVQVLPSREMQERKEMPVFACTASSSEEKARRNFPTEGIGQSP